MFENWFKTMLNNWVKEEPKIEEEVKSAEKDKNSIIRIVIKYNSDGSFRPTTYFEVDDQEDLFNNKEKFEEIKQHAVECCKEVDEEGKLRNYSIMEIPNKLPQELFTFEAQFSLLNSHLNIRPKDCMVLDISDLISDEKMSSALKFQMMVMNFCVKIFRGIDFHNEGSHLDYSIVKSDMRITPTGAVEKYLIKWFDKYDLTFYNVNVE